VRARLFELLMQAPDFRKLVPNTRSIATDMSKSIISAHELDLPLRKKVIDLRFHYADQAAGPDDKRYKATITFVHEFSAQDIREYVSGVVRTPPYDANAMIHALNIVLAKFPLSGMVGNKKVVKIGSGDNKFFILETQPDDLGSGLVAYRGYYSSIRPTFNRVLCNINVCTGAFFKPQSLAAMIDQVCPGGEFSSLRGGIGHKSIDGLKVLTHYLGSPKIFTLKGLGGTVCEEEFYWEDEKSTVTVEYYFKKSESAVPFP
jgi:eukaryotic translation initiation factor 2C